MTVRPCLFIASCVLLTAVTGTTALGHHGFSGRYDLSRPIWIEGEVVRAYFGPPHAELTIRTAPSMRVPSPLPRLGPTASFIDAGSLRILTPTQGRTFRLELPPTQQYFGLRSRVAVGDRIAVVALRNCERPHQLNVQWLRPAKGAIVARSAPMSYMARQC